VLDVWKYGLALRGGSLSDNCTLDTWGIIGLTNKASLHERVHALAPLKKRQLDKLKLQAAHPILGSFSPFALRVRFAKGFAPAAFEELRVHVWERLAKAMT